MVKEFFGGIKFALGIFVVLGLGALVYAFVEPSQGPGAGSYHIDTSSSIYGKLLELESKIENVNDTVTSESGIDATPSEWSCTTVVNTGSGGGSAVATATASCSAGTTLITGGCEVGNIDYGDFQAWAENNPLGNGWQCTAILSATDSGWYVDAVARCCS